MSLTIHSKNPPAVRIEGAAHRVLSFAAGELRRYLGAILNVELGDVGTPAVVVAAGSAASGFEGEAYTIRVAADGVRIEGAGPAGALYGVYEFLRRYGGCRFSNPGPDGERIPRRSELRLPPGELARRPLLKVRGMQIAGRHDPDRMRGQVDWMAKIGLNTIMTLPKADDDPSQARVDRDPATGEDRRSGGSRAYTDGWFREQVGPALLDRGMTICMANHNFRRWVPPHRHFAEHPEWYALVDGARNPNVGQMCLCTSNEAMQATLIENVRQYLRDNPEVSIVGICPEDGMGSCQCDVCRALDGATPGGSRRGGANWRTPEGENRSLVRRYALLVNAVARALRAEFPGVWVYYSAYIDLMWPPRDVTLEDNVVVMLSLYWRCAAHRIAPDACEMNRFLNGILQRWHAAHRGPLLVNDYYYGMNAQRVLPYPMGELACADWPGYRQAGVVGGKTNTDSAQLAVYGLNYLAFGRSGWEEPVDYAALRAEFLEGLFGAAAPALEPVYAAFDEAVRKVGRGEAGESRWLRPAPPAKGCLLPNARNIVYFLEEVGLDFIRERIRQAESLASDARERRQVARFKDAVEYWRLCRDYLALRMDAEEAERANSAHARKLFRLAHQAVRAVQAHAQRIKNDGWALAPEGFAREEARMAEQSKG